MVKLAELPTEELLAPGHRMCAGCAAPIIVRQTMKSIRGPTVVVNATGCLEVATTIYPYTAWRVPWIHVAFENAAAVASGVEAAFKVMAKRGCLKEKIDIITFGGDGGTFDIGIQALSGALERGHDFVYICYDNEAYMNTGIQRSGSTPHGAATTTSPAGTVIPGKPEWKKDIVGIAAAHGIEFVATASPAYWSDYMAKVRRAIEVDGPAFIHVIQPCLLGWRFNSNEAIKIARLAVQTRFFPIYHVERGQYKLDIKIPKPLPVEEYLKPQGRFRHLLTPENKGELERIQAWVDANWARICQLAGEKI